MKLFYLSALTIAALASCSEKPQTSSKLTANNTELAEEQNGTDPTEVTLEQVAKHYKFAAKIPQTHSLTIAKTTSSSSALPQPISTSNSLQTLFTHSAWTLSGANNFPSQLDTLSKIGHKLRSIHYSSSFKELIASVTEKSADQNVYIEQAKFLTSRQGLTYLDSFEIPSTILAFRIDSTDSRQQWSDHLHNEILHLCSDNNLSITQEATPFAGSIFRGVRFNGEALLESWITKNAGALDSLSERRMSALRSALKKKQGVLLTGVVDDHLLLFIGNSVKDLSLARSPDQSILAKDNAKPLYQFTNKKILGYALANREALTSFKRLLTYSSSLVEGVEMALTETPQLPPTPDLERSIDKLVDNEANLLEMHEEHPLAAVLYDEDGWKLNIHGGYRTPYFNHNKATAIPASNNALLTANFAIASDGFHHVLNTFEAVTSSTLLFQRFISSLPKNSTKLDTTSLTNMPLWQTFRSSILRSLRGSVHIELHSVSDAPQFLIAAETKNAAQVQQGINKLISSAPESNSPMLTEALSDYTMQASGSTISWQTPSSSPTIAIDSTHLSVSTLDEPVDAIHQRLKKSTSHQGFHLSLDLNQLRSALAALSPHGSLLNELQDLQSLHLQITEKESKPQLLLHLKSSN